MKPYIHIVGKVELFEFREQGLMGNGVESLAEIEKKQLLLHGFSPNVGTNHVSHAEVQRQSTFPSGIPTGS